MEKEQLYKKAFEKWGKELQFLMVIEECAEVQQAISKMLRKGIDNKFMPTQLMEEIADLEITLEQLEIFFKYTDNGNYRKLIEIYKEQKIKKLESILS